METSSEIALKCWYKPSCVGLLYDGTVNNNPSTSAASANLLNLTLSLVLLFVVPAIKGCSEPILSFTTENNLSFSWSFIVGASPVVPPITKPSLPLSIIALDNFAAIS